MNALPASLRTVFAWWRRHRILLLFGVALLFGALAVFGARGYIAERLEIEKARLTARRAMVEVVVARRDLERGARVAPENMAIREMPAEFMPGSVVRPERFERHIGARLDAPMRSGEPLLSGTIVGTETGAFSGRIRQGIRAMSVLVDEVNSVSGMLQPGDRIDLLFSVRPPAAPGRPQAAEVTVTLMQDVAVLATGRQVRAGGDDGSTPRHFTAITVEVSPDQAQRLIVAQRSGRLTAMLRHPDDRQPLGSRVFDLNALLGIAPPVPTATAVPGPEIIVGGRGALVAAHAPSPGPALAMALPETGEQAAPAGWALRRPGSARAAAAPRRDTAAGATAAGAASGGAASAGATAAGATALAGDEGKIR